MTSAVAKKIRTFQSEDTIRTLPRIVNARFNVLIAMDLPFTHSLALSQSEYAICSLMAISFCRRLRYTRVDISSFIIMLAFADDKVNTEHNFVSIHFFDFNR